MMNYLLALIAIFCFASFFCISAVILKNRNILTIIALSLSFFYISYLAISAVLLYMDEFNVTYCIGIQAVLCLVLLGIRFSKISQAIRSITVNWKELTLVIVFVSIAMICSHAKTERITMGADEALYYEKAIALVQGDASYTYSVEEYGEISASVDQGLLELQSKQVGLYTSSITDDKLEYEYHALPLWPAFMALFMKVFGIFNGPYALSYVFLLAIISGYCCIEVTACYRKSKYLIFPLFAFLPLGIYLAKVTLSEMAYAALLISAYFLILQKPVRILSAIPLGLLGFMHISSMMYVPVISIVLFCAYILTRERTYGWINIIVCILYMCSLQYAFKVSKLYSEMQLHYTILGFNILPILYLCFCIMIVMQLLSFYAVKKDLSLLKFSISVYHKHKKKVLVICVIFLAVYTVYQGYLLGFTDTYMEGTGNWAIRSTYANRGLLSIARLNIFSILMATGYLCVPYIVYRIFSKKSNLDHLDIALCTLFLEGLFIYTVARCDISTNYYASRYFMTMLVPAAIFLTAKMIRGKRGFITISFVSAVTALPFVIALIPMVCYGGSVDLFRDVARAVEADTIVFVDKDDSINATLVNNLREINGNRVYEIDNWEEVCEYYYNQGEDDFYFVATDQVSIDEALRERTDIPVLRKEYEILGDIMRAGTIYPLTQGDSQIVDIKVYKIVTEQLEYQFGDNENFMTEDFYGSGGTHRWTKEESSFYAALNGDCNYKMTISLATFPPLERAGRESLEVSVLVNGQAAGTFVLSTEAPGTEFTVDIDNGLLMEGIKNNLITFVSEVWTPAAYGSADTRYLGIPIAKVAFDPIIEQLEYPFGGNESFVTEDFHGNEGTFRWTQEESSFYAALNGDCSYEMKISLSGFPPLELAGRESLEVSVLVNGQAADTFALSAEAPTTEFTVEIDRALLMDGIQNNMITFVSEVWTPADYGSADTRYLGIPIKEVTFERIEVS